MEHFGVQLMNRGKAFNISKEEFALVNTNPSLPFFPELAKQNAYADADGSAYSEEWCKEYRELCLRNFDLNMHYFSTLDEVEFNGALEKFFQKYKRFVAVSSLNEYREVEGYYIMVLDEYKQVYIGKTKDIRKRIMQHWSKTKPFDRTLLPMYAWNTSTFSIDFFRALDTTRIFVWKKKMTDSTEAKLIRDFPSKFCTNRIGGDATNLIQAIETMNHRSLL